MSTLFSALCPAVITDVSELTATHRVLHSRAVTFNLRWCGVCGKCCLLKATHPCLNIWSEDVKLCSKAGFLVIYVTTNVNLEILSEEVSLLVISLVTLTNQFFIFHHFHHCAQRIFFWDFPTEQRQQHQSFQQIPKNDIYTFMWQRSPVTVGIITQTMILPETDEVMFF